MNRFVVVGAGPAGLTLALQLARSGHAVTLVEASSSFSRQFRGDALMPCGQEALARMGLWNLLETLPQRDLEGWSVWIEGRRLFEVREPMGSLQPCRLVPQQRLLEALLEQALAEPMLQWRPGERVSDLLRDDERISGVVLADGERLQADLVVGCDGRDSSLRRLADLKLEGVGRPLELLWFELPAPLRSQQLPGFNTLLTGGAIGSACVGARGDLQLAWLLRPGERRDSRNTEAWAQALATLQPPALAAELRERCNELNGPLRLSVQVGRAQRWQLPGLLLLGDAAHPMSPVRAQGINMALRDSLVAAELLATASAEQLDQVAAEVERQRLPEIKRMQQLQQAEARQGHWLGHNTALRLTLAALAPMVGPLAAQVWSTRQKPLREGLAGALPEAELGPQRTNSISW